MKRMMRWQRSSVLLLVLALLIGACAGDAETTTSVEGATTTTAEGATTTEAGATTTEATETTAPPVAGGSLSQHISEPQFLTPGNATESEGILVLQQLFRGLIEYDPATTEVVNAVAASIETEDNQNWTVTLNPGWTFHNGEPVTASSFVDAWNYGALGTNAQQNASFFSNIEGYEEVNPAPPEGSETPPPPTAETLSGLAVVDDTTFTVALSAPNSQWVLTLGYAGFYPLPEAFYDDPDGYNEAPIGNGPFMMSGTWEHDVAINLVRYEDYAGPDPASIDGVEFRIYADIATAYNDLLAGNLDIMVDLPTEVVGEAAATFGDDYLEQPDSGYTYIGFPLYDDRFASADLRRALSMAIDREAITEAIFSGTRTAAHSWISPVIPGHRENPCENGATTYDPAAAKELFDSAGGYEGTMTLWFNSGAGHDAWVEAVSNMWRDNLGIAEFEFQSLDFAEYLGVGDEQGFTGPFRLGWGMDYPSPQNFLEPLLGTGAFPPGSNYPLYSSAEFDDLIAQGNAATTLEEAIPLYQQAEDLLCVDMPTIPMFFGLDQAATSPNVGDLVVDAYGDVRYELVTAAG